VGLVRFGRQTGEIEAKKRPMIELKPRFWRVALRVGTLMTIFLIVIHLSIMLRSGITWGLGNIVVFVIPTIFMVTGVWFAFVPSWFQYSDNEISLRTLLRQGTHAWDMLDAYGPGPNVFMIQFKGDGGAYQIFPGAYSRKDWQAFKNFLETRFPDQKTSFSIGGRLIRRD
jgi:hypothetical protein